MILKSFFICTRIFIFCCKILFRDSILDKTEATEPIKNEYKKAPNTIQKHVIVLSHSMRDNRGEKNTFQEWLLEEGHHIQQLQQFAQQDKRKQYISNLFIG